MKRTAFLIFLVITTVSDIFSQQKGANISFDERVFDFGQIDESKGIVTHRFDFTNTGSEPLIIQNVSTSCGCTTPSWTNTPVKPGEKGYVSAAFDPSNRPGQFEKIIAVQTTASTQSVQLKITGQVKGKVLTIDDEFPVDFRGLKLKTNTVSFGNIHKGQQQTNIIEMINFTNAPLTIKTDPLPAYIKINIPKQKLNPKETGIIEVTFNSALKDDWGFVVDRIIVHVGNTTDTKDRLTVSANIDEDFTSLSPEQKKNAPVISFSQLSHDFGTLKPGAVYTHEYKFTNIGKSNLLIRKVTSSCGCTAVNASSQSIAPGKTGVIRVNFNSAGENGKQGKVITVISNDPVSPRVMLSLNGEVSN